MALSFLPAMGRLASRSALPYQSYRTIPASATIIKNINTGISRRTFMMSSGEAGPSTRVPQNHDPSSRVVGVGGGQEEARPSTDVEDHTQHTEVKGGLYGGDPEEIEEQDHAMRDRSSAHDQLKGPQQPEARGADPVEVQMNTSDKTTPGGEDETTNADHPGGKAPTHTNYGN